MPKSDATRLSQTELAVVERVGNLRKKGLEDYELQIDVYARRIRGARAKRENIEITAKQFMTRFGVERRECANYLNNAMELVAGSHKKLEAYRDRHGTIGSPYASKNAALMIGILSIVFLIEVTLSGTLFAEKNNMGLVGGIGTALVISGVNVIACLLCGFGVRYINLRDWVAKIFGCMTMLLFLGVSLGLNLVVAHFRDALELHEWQAAAFQAIISLRANAIGIDSFNSWLVAGVGGMVSVVAFLEGLFWHDRHPGFNKTYVAAENAVSDYARKYEQAQNQLEELYIKASDELKGHAQTMRADMLSAIDAVGNRSTLTRRLNDFLEMCDRAVNQLHARYREANTRIRSDQRPKYFDTDYRFPIYTAEQELAGINKEEARAEIKKIDETVEAGVKKILDAQKEAISAFRTVEELKNQLRSKAGAKAYEQESAKAIDDSNSGGIR